MGSDSLANLTSVLTKGDIPAIMQMVFDGPLIAGQFQQTGGTSLFREEAGDPIDNLLCIFEGMFNASA